MNTSSLLASHGLVRAQTLRSLIVLMTPLLLGVLNGCSKPVPERGVRPEFRNQEVNTIVMTPFYSRSSMGLSSEERETLHAKYESMTVAKLEQLGFDVISPEAFSQSLVEHDAWQIYEDGWTFRHGLEDYFRSGDGAQPAIEVLTLQALAKKQALASKVVLFGEVVYQSETTCIVLADEQVSFAVVDRAQGVELKKGADGNPCVVSNLQAMLVDAESEHVMWNNQGLVELHVTEHSEQSITLAIERVIDLVFSGEAGLMVLSGR